MKIEIDGRDYDVDGGKLIDVLLDLGFDIPHLCYHKAIGSFGACRLCLVEVEEKGEWKIQASCSIDVKEGLRVRTNSSNLFEIRKSIVELLSKYTFSKIVKELASQYNLEARGKRICILCGLCVNVCSLLGIEAIAFEGRGFEKRVSTPFNDLSDICRGCLSCTNLCPTGAIRFENGDIIVGERTLAKHEVVRCKICGREIATKKFIESLDIGDIICEDCKKRDLAKRFAESLRL